MTTSSKPNKQKKEIEFECACFGHRMAVEVGDDKEVYFSITEKKKGRPKWIEVVLWREDVKRLLKLLK